jgi:hypothetical protein
LAAFWKCEAGYIRYGVAGQIKMLQVLWKDNGGKANYFVDAQIKRPEIFGELRAENACNLIAAQQNLLQPLGKANGVRYARNPVGAHVQQGQANG